MLCRLAWVAVAASLVASGSALGHHRVGEEASAASATVLDAWVAFAAAAPPGCAEQRMLALGPALEHAAGASPDPCQATSDVPLPVALAAARELGMAIAVLPREATSSLHASTDDQVAAFCAAREEALLTVLGESFGDCPPPTFGLVPVLLRTSEAGSLILVGLGEDLGLQGLSYASTVHGFGAALAGQTAEEANEGAIALADLGLASLAPLQCSPCVELAQRWVLSCAEAAAAPSEARCFALYLVVANAGVAAERAHGLAQEALAPAGGMPAAPAVPEPGPVPEAPALPEPGPVPEPVLPAL